MLYISSELKKDKIEYKYITEDEVKEVMQNLESIKEKPMDEKENKKISFIIYLLENDFIPVEFFTKQSDEEIEELLNYAQEQLSTLIQKSDEGEFRKRIENSKLIENLQATKAKQIRNMPTSAYIF